jgi:hypothetical protein
MSTVKGTDGLSLNIQHEYVTLRTPNGNYTTSYGGARASGKLASHDTAFQTINEYVENSVKNSNMTYGDVMKTLLDPKILSSLWSEWNEKIQPNLFLPGDNVKFTDTYMLKRYPNGGKVVKVARKNVFIQLVDANEVCGFDYQLMIKTN